MRLAAIHPIALLLALASVEDGFGQTRGRLQVGPSKRHLQWQDGTPFF